MYRTSIKALRKDGILRKVTLRFKEIFIQAANDDFTELDIGGHDLITSRDMTTSFNHKPLDHCQNFIGEIDVNCFGSLTFNDLLYKNELFKTFIADLVPVDETLTRESLFRSFRQFDKKGKGFVCFTCLKKKLLTLGKPLTETEAMDFFKSVPKTPEGYIRYPALIHMMVKDDVPNRDASILSDRRKFKMKKSDLIKEDPYKDIRSASDRGVYKQMSQTVKSIPFRFVGAVVALLSFFTPIYFFAL